MVPAVPAVVVAALMRRGAETARCSTIPDSDEEQGCNSEGHNVILLPLKLQVRFTLPRRESKGDGMTSHGDAPCPPVLQPLGDDTRMRERGC